MHDHKQVFRETETCGRSRPRRGDNSSSSTCGVTNPLSSRGHRSRRAVLCPPLRGDNKGLLGGDLVLMIMAEKKTQFLGPASTLQISLWFHIPCATILPRAQLDRLSRVERAALMKFTGRRSQRRVLQGDPRQHGSILPYTPEKI